MATIKLAVLKHTRAKDGSYKIRISIGQSMKQNRPIFNYVKIMRQHADVAIRQILDALKTDDPHEPSAH